MTLILHLLAADEAVAAVAAGHDYAPATYGADGFVHCTGDDATLLEVANAFYRDRREPMVAWTIDTDRLTSEVRWEAPAPPDGSAADDTAVRFPHIYGPIALAAVTATRAMRRDEHGRFTGYDAAS